MNKRVIAFLSILSLFLSSPLIPTSAVWKGTLDTENKRAVPVLYGPTGACNSSGFLYSPRIVFTAAHVLHLGDDRKTEHIAQWPSLWIGYPGEVVSTTSRRIESEKFFVPTNYEGRDLWKGGNTATRKNDFAVIVLKSPLPVDAKKIELLTPELHDKYILNKEPVSLTGYGYQAQEDHGKCREFKTPSSFNSNITEKTVSTGRYAWVSTLNTRVDPGMPNMCDGDSGSGYVKIFPNRYIYLGASGSGSYGNHNCESYKPYLTEVTISASDPVYLYKELIAEAVKYVAANPYIDPSASKLPVGKKVTISCIKGKATIKVSGANPKCPKGYKKAS
jgi:hypothetical protein